MCSPLLHPHPHFTRKKKSEKMLTWEKYLISKHYVFLLTLSCVNLSLWGWKKRHGGEIQISLKTETSQKGINVSLEDALLPQSVNKPNKDWRMRRKEKSRWCFKFINEFFFVPKAVYSLMGPPGRVNDMMMTMFIGLFLFSPFKLFCVLIFYNFPLV